MDDPSAQLLLAERVVETARGLGIETALIGANAMAVHNYVRGTEDVDLASAVDPGTQLVALQRAVEGAGLRTVLRLPDEDGPRGGVLVVWEHSDDDGDPVDPVEVVNFVNPHRRRASPAMRAIERAEPIDTGSPVRCVRLPDLVALKLYAGSRMDLADIVELLVRNPDADLDDIRATGAPFDPAGVLEELIAEAARQR